MSTVATPVLGHAGEQLDLFIRQGATFGPHQLTLSNPDGSAVNLTGATVRGQLRRRALTAGAPLATLTVTVISAAAGVLEFGLSAAQTGALSAGESVASAESRAVWDLELQDSLGGVTPIYFGNVTIFREVTR